VHIRAIHPPFRYPHIYSQPEGGCVSSNENYLLQAFLALSATFMVELAAELVFRNHTAEFAAAFPRFDFSRHREPKGFRIRRVRGAGGVKQVLQTGGGLTTVRDVPAPACPPAGVLVQNTFSVISPGTEGARVALAQKSLLAKARGRPDLVQKVIERARREGLRSTRDAVRRQLAAETPVGYSSAGHVIEVGPRASGVDPGDAVACCGGGHANHAEIVAMPRNLIAQVPDGVTLDHAAFSTIAAVALHGLRLAEVSLGERIVVIGCGLIGQLACRLVRIAGARVVAMDIDHDRVAAALAAGADYGVTVDDGAEDVVATVTGGVGADAVLVTAGADTNAPLLLAAEIARDRGRIVLVGAMPISFPREQLYAKELSFRVSRSYGPGRYDVEYEEHGLDYPIEYVRWTEQRNLESVLEFMASGKLAVADLIDEVVPVEKAPEAYQRLVGEPSVRPRGAIVIKYPARQDSPRLEVSEPLPREKPPRTGEGVAVALLGPGSFASRVLVPALQAAGATLETVGGGAGPSAATAARDLGFRRVAASEEEALCDPHVDAVVIATRHADHAKLAAAALEAGKSVFVEKPLALSVAELRLVVDTAYASPGILAVGFNRRFSPLLREAGEFLSARRASPATMAFRVSAGRLGRDHWVHDLEVGGGRILGELCHFIDSLRVLAGAPVSDVYAAAQPVSGAPLQARDNLIMTLRYRDGSVGTIVYAADGGAGLRKERLEVFRGSRTVVLDDFVQLQLYGAHRPRRHKLRSQNKGHNAEIAAFIQGVARGRYPVPLSEIEEVTLTTLAVVESLRTGQPVSVTLRPAAA
jgi:predicted dehydrogenase